MRGVRRATLVAVGAAALLLPASASAATTDLSITKSDSPDPVREGELLTYTINTSNLSPDAATNVVVTDELDSGVQFVSASAGCDLQGKTVTCTLASVPSSPAAGPTLTITVRPKNAGQITNTATIATGPGDNDPNTANNTATTTTTVTAAGGGGGGGGGGAGSAAGGGGSGAGGGA